MGAPLPAAALKSAEVKYRAAAAAVGTLEDCENTLQKKLEEALRQSQKCEEAINHIFTNQSYPSKKFAQNLERENINAFDLERAVKECDAEFQAEWQRVDDLFQKLLIKRQQNSLLLLQTQLDNRIQIIKQGIPIQILRIVTNLSLIAQDLEHYPASPLVADDDQQLLWASSFTETKKQQETLFPIGKFLADLDLHAKNPPHNCPFSNNSSLSQYEAILQRYRNQYGELKKMCINMWNNSIQLRIKVEIKLTLIESSLQLKASLPEIKGKFAQLEKDLETLRHQFKGKNRPETEKHLVANRTHLSKRFKEMKTTFYDLLGIWKNVFPRYAASLIALKTQIEQLKNISTQALEADFKPLLDVEVPSWILLFQNAPAGIKIHLEEIAVWMDITSAMIDNPTCSEFPQRGTFIAASLLGQYKEYTTFRDEIKRLYP